MEHDEERTPPLTVQLYRAALNPTEWKHCLGALARDLQSDAAVLSVRSVETDETVFSAAGGVDSELESFLMADAPASVTPLKDYVSLEIDFPCDDFHQASLLIFRQNGRGPFQQVERKKLALLQPHLARVIRIHQELAQSNRAAEAARRALDQISTGVLLVAGDGRVIEKNQGAESILERKDGLQLTPDGRLRAGTPEETSRLLDAIGRACGNAREWERRPGAVAVSRPSLERAHAVSVIPLGAGSADSEAARPMAAVLVNDPERKPSPHPKLLETLYGLTPAEARLATLLMQGCSLDEAAARFGVSKSTIRNQAKSIFVKTGVHGQSELVRLLLSGPAGL